MGILTKHSPEKSNAPHMPGVRELGLNIGRDALVKKLLLAFLFLRGGGLGKLIETHHVI